jgi:hypothetical protein
VDVDSFREVAESVLCHHDCGFCNKTGDKQLNRRPRSDGLVRKVTVLAVFRLLKRPSGPLREPTRNFTKWLNNWTPVERLNC